MTRDVVVTRLGALTPLSPSVDASWAAALDDQSGAARISHFDPEAANLRSRIACETPFDPADYDAVDPRRMGRYAQYAVVAATQALADANLDPEAGSWPAERVGTSIGTGFAGLPEIEATVGERPSTTFVPSTLANSRWATSACTSTPGGRPTPRRRPVPPGPRRWAPPRTRSALAAQT